MNHPHYNKPTVHYLSSVYFASIPIHPKTIVNTIGAVTQRMRGRQKATTTARLNMDRVVSSEIIEALVLTIPCERGIRPLMLIPKERL